MPSKGEKWMELRKNPNYLHIFTEFNQLSLPLQNCLKQMIAENPLHRPTIKQIINIIDENKCKEKLWENITERAIKQSKALSPKFKKEKILVSKSKSYNN